MMDLEEAINNIMEADPTAYNNVLCAMGESNEYAIIEIRLAAAFFVLESSRLEVDADTIAVIKQAVRNIAATGNYNGYKPIKTDINISELM